MTAGIRPEYGGPIHMWVSSKFVWEKDKQGNYKLVFPELLERVTK